LTPLFYGANLIAINRKRDQPDVTGQAQSVRMP
jgi:hypothetical protein